MKSVFADLFIFLEKFCFDSMLKKKPFEGCGYFQDLIP